MEPAPRLETKRVPATVKDVSISVSVPPRLKGKRPAVAERKAAGDKGNVQARKQEKEVSSEGFREILLYHLEGRGISLSHSMSHSHSLSHSHSMTHSALCI
jgi:hypothetical protein